MTFDGLFTHAMVQELNHNLAGGRIVKIHQPYSNEVFLIVRNNYKNYPVLLSTHPNFARAQISYIKYSNPQTASNFVMMLRKHLEGAKLLRVDQIENDRIIKFSTTGRNELGDEEKISLYLEMMGRHSNLFLVNEVEQKIIDLIKHVSPDQNRVRSLIPGGIYVMPPKQDVLNPFKTLYGLAQLILDYPVIVDLANALQNHFQGLAKDSALEFATILHNEGDPLLNAQIWLDNFNKVQPQIVQQEHGIKFLPFSWQTVSGVIINYNSLSEMLDDYFIEKSERDRVNQQANVVLRVIKNELKKNRNKVKKFRQELLMVNQANSYKIKGELLTTYMHKIERGMTTISLPNYYDNNKLLKIELSNQLSPSRNAQKYFTKYNKLKISVKYINEQMKLANLEIDYFENLQVQVNLAAPRDIEEIKQELIQEGYLRIQNKKKQKPKFSVPEKFYATNGTLIEVGKNNLQNERLSMKMSSRNDIWLHTKDIPGSHVVIHDSNPSAETLKEGAILAAYFSKARNSSKVLVDFLPVRRLRKPNGSKPGFVIFEGQQTMSVIPQYSIVEKLRKN